MNEGKKHLAGVYAAMMASEAWADLVRYADSERELSMKRIDDTSAADLSLGHVCEERGVRKGLMKLIQHAEYCKEGI